MKEISLEIERENLDSMAVSEGPRYPVLHYDGDEELDLPCCGTMTVVFKVVGETSRERNGKHSYSCDIEIRSITNVKSAEPKAPASSGSEAGSALDKLAEEYAKHEAEEDDEDDTGEEKY